MDQADGRVGADRGVGVVEPAGVEGVEGVEGPAFLIRQICQIGRIFSEGSGNGSDFGGFWAVGEPLGKTAVAEVVFVVEEEFLETRAGHIHEAEFRLR